MERKTVRPLDISNLQVGEDRAWILAHFGLRLSCDDDQFSSRTVSSSQDMSRYRRVDHSWGSYVFVALRILVCMGVVRGGLGWRV